MVCAARLCCSAIVKRGDQRTGNTRHNDDGAYPIRGPPSITTLTLVVIILANKALSAGAHPFYLCTRFRNIHPPAGISTGGRRSRAIAGLVCDQSGQGDHVDRWRAIGGSLRTWQLVAGWLACLCRIVHVAWLGHRQYGI